MKIIVTGASGFLGCRIARFLQFSHSVVGLSSKELDITDADRVMDLFMEHCPKAVIHCAALSDTRYCAENEDDSYVVNVGGTINVAKACLAVGAKLVYMSSDQVYNGCSEKGDLGENCSLQPQGVYARHKWLMEEAVQLLLPSAVGLRLSWMYDLPSSPLRQNEGLLVKLKRLISEGEKMKVSTKEFRGITNVWEVAQRVEAAIQLEGGIYNFGSPAKHSSFEIYREALQLLLQHEGSSLETKDFLIEDSSWERNLAMDNRKIREKGLSFPESLVQLSNLLKRV